MNICVVTAVFTVHYNVSHFNDSNVRRQKQISYQLVVHTLFSVILYVHVASSCKSIEWSHSGQSGDSLLCLSGLDIYRSLFSHSGLPQCLHSVIAQTHLLIQPTIYQNDISDSGQEVRLHHLL